MEQATSYLYSLFNNEEAMNNFVDAVVSETKFVNDNEKSVLDQILLIEEMCLKIRKGLKDE